MSLPKRSFWALPAFFASAIVQAAAPARPAATAPAGGEGLEAVRKAWTSADYRFTPEVRKALIAHEKAEALRKLSTAGKTLPSDFLAWVESDPQIQATVYGAGLHDPAAVLILLRSLDLDLGADAVRKKYPQLALAAAIVYAAQADKADLSPRPPLKLQIGGDPRKPVNTKDPNRKLDLNDHIVNFLNEHTIEEDVVVGHKEQTPELKYDAKGVAIPPPKTKGKPKMVPVTEKRKRTLTAADVIASQDLQDKFNAYMKARGCDVRVDCGDKVVHWNSHDMVRGQAKQNIANAFKLFRTAYEAKGLLPAQRDPTPTPGENCAYLIRNHEYRFAPELAAQRKWPRYPLNAPWPTLTLLVVSNQPLREREERWLAFRDRGEFKTYGQYIGSIAQQYDMQSAKRLTPFAFTYGSIQMMLKDGGVCGAMAGISVRSHCTLGVPACTAGQPGHCALILFAHDPKSDTYRCHGGQYATGGDDKTHPHGPWFFDETHPRRPMIYHQSVAWGVNVGMPAYLDSNLAFRLYRLLPPADRQAHGLDLLQSGLALNPYNFLLIDAGLAQAGAASQAVAFWKSAAASLASLNRPGCPTGGLFVQTVRDKLFAALTKLPAPKEPAEAATVLAFLNEQKCDNASTLAHYKLATAGLDALLTDARAALEAHLKSERTPASGQQIADTLRAAAERIPDRKKRREWASICWPLVRGHECFLGHRSAVTLDPAAAALARLAGQKLPPQTEQVQPLLDFVAAQLKTDVANGRSPKPAAQLAQRIKALAAQVNDAEQKRKWLEELAAVMRGHEEYTPPQPPASKKRPAQPPKPLRDPCADVIRDLLAPPATQPAK